MHEDSLSTTREAHRLLAFIYFTCAEADASWVNEETFALYEFLEQQAGGLSREESVALAQEAYQRYLKLGHLDARVGYIEAELPTALGHLSRGQRGQLLDNLVALSEVDGKTSRRETEVVRRVERALHEAPHEPVPDAPRDEEIRLLAFIYFTFADADGRWTNEETVALYEFLEQQSGSPTRERSVALAQEAYRQLLRIPTTEDRLQAIAERVPRAFHGRSEAERKQVLNNLVELARADGRFSATEGRVLEAMRQLLL